MEILAGKIKDFFPDGFEPCVVEKKYGRPADMCAECIKKKSEGLVSWEELDESGFSTGFSFKCQKYPCEKYPELLAKRKAEILEKSGIPDEYKTKSVREYKAVDEKTGDVRKKVTDYAYACDKSSFKSWLYLAGQTGSGKTHLACAAGINLIRCGKKVKMFSWPDLMREVKNFKYENFESAKNAEVLILDDLYKGIPTQEEKKRTFELIDFRRSNGLQTIITTERENKEMNDLDSAVIGRIVEACDGYWAFIPKSDAANHRMKEFLR